MNIINLNQIEESYLISSRFLISLSPSLLPPPKMNQQKSYKPIKPIEKGNRGWGLKQIASMTLGSGNMSLAVELPAGEEKNEWLAVNAIEFYNEISILYGTLMEVWRAFNTLYRHDHHLTYTVAYLVLHDGGLSNNECWTEVNELREVCSMLILPAYLLDMSTCGLTDRTWRHRWKSPLASTSITSWHGRSHRSTMKHSSPCRSVSLHEGRERFQLLPPQACPSRRTLWVLLRWYSRDYSECTRTFTTRTSNT